MAFAYTVEKQTTFGDRNVSYGTFTSTSGSTGGDIVTSLKRVDNISLQITGAAVEANAPSVNETLPLASGSVTIVTDADAAGTWFAIGL